MTASIIILSREDARSRTFPRASRLRAHGKAHSEHREREYFRAICAGEGFAARVAGIASISTETHSRSEIRSPAIHFQSAAANPSGSVIRSKSSPAAVLARASSWFAKRPAPLWHFLFRTVGAFKALRSLIPSLRIQPAKQSRCGFSKCFRSFSSAVFHASKETHGAFRWNEKVFPNSTKVLAKVK